MWPYDNYQQQEQSYQPYFGGYQSMYQPMYQPYQSYFGGYQPYYPSNTNNNGFDLQALIDKLTSLFQQQSPMMQQSQAPAVQQPPTTANANITPRDPATTQNSILSQANPAPSPAKPNTDYQYGGGFGNQYMKTGTFGQQGLNQIHSAGYKNQSDFLANDPRGQQMASNQAKAGFSKNKNFG